jgi:hypothetical protein
MVVLSTGFSIIRYNQVGANINDIAPICQSVDYPVLISVVSLTNAYEG